LSLIRPGRDRNLIDGYASQTISMIVVAGKTILAATELTQT